MNLYGVFANAAAYWETDEFAKTNQLYVVML